MNDNNLRFADEFGSQYDIFHDAVPWHDEFQYSIVKELKKHFVNQTDLVFLEAGFGTGITTKTVLKEFHTAKIIAIDNVPDMVHKAEQYLGTDNLQNVNFVIGDLYDQLKLIPSATVDGFYSGYVLHNINSEIRKEIIAEIYRILKPGGIYVNGDRIALDDEKAQIMALSQAIINCDVFVKKHNNPEFYLEWVKHYLRDEEPDLIFRASNQVKLLEQAGFSNIEYVYAKNLEQTCKAIK